jgi:hypothetical protein
MQAKPKENLLPLKIFVWSMGLVLIGGFTFVVATLINGKPSSLPCPHNTITLDSSAPVRVLSASKEQIRVVVENSAQEQTVLTIDACTGKTIQHINIFSKPK